MVGTGHLQYLSALATSHYLQVGKPNTEFPDSLEDRGVMAYEIQADIFKEAPGKGYDFLIYYTVKQD